MGLYERDYGRDEEMTPWEMQERAQRPKSMVIILLVVTVGVFFLDLLTAKQGGDQLRSTIADWFACRKGTLIEPWTWFQFLTYGFLHDVNNIFHVALNMLGLFVFGRTLEFRLGRFEFLRFYLVAIVVGGIVGSLTYWVMGASDQSSVIGASGAVSALIILFACVDPQAELLLMGVWPIKAWVLAAVFLATNIFGSVSMFSPSQDTLSGGTAYTVHLAGAAFGYLYHLRGWNLRWLDFSSAGDRFKGSLRRTKLKIHDPDEKLQQEVDDVDQILAKIHASGEESLTRAERRTLERHSRRQRQRREREGRD